jgi:hypothetical protein
MSVLHALLGITTDVTNYGRAESCRLPESSPRFSGPETVLREDGGSGDIGYPWSAPLAGGRILSVYYFNRENGTRHIAGTILAI